MDFSTIKRRLKKTEDEDNEEEETIEGFFFIPVFDFNDTKPLD
jgi:hypothetical protein